MFGELLKSDPNLSGHIIKWMSAIRLVLCYNRWVQKWCVVWNAQFRLIERRLFSVSCPYGGLSEGSILSIILIIKRCPLHQQKWTWLSLFERMVQTRIGSPQVKPPQKFGKEFQEIDHFPFSLLFIAAYFHDLLSFIILQCVILQDGGRTVRFDVSAHIFSMPQK